MDRRRAFEKRHKELGLCTKCSRPVLDGSNYCAIHLTRARKLMRDNYTKDPERFKARSRANREKCLENGLCVSCQNAVADAGTRCSACSIKQLRG